MDFDNKLPEWKNEGVEPSEELKTNGFVMKLKPPADIFNWFWSKVIKAITELQTKLDKVDNTSDAEKSVKFASEAKEARKVQDSLTVRFKGGDTEGTDKWTFDGSTSRSVNITPKKIGASEEEHTHSVKDVKDTVAATSTDGVNYTATVEGITELYNGLTITIIPNMLSTSKNTTLNVNGLGAKQLRCSIGGYNFGNSGTIAALDGWLGENCPVTIQYRAKFDNWQTIISRPSVTGLYGTLKVEQGGTGATDAATARENLGAAAASEHNLKTYTNLSQLGLSDGATLSQVARKLPNGSKIKIYVITTSNANLAPNATNGWFEAYRPSVNHVVFQYTTTSLKRYIADALNVDTDTESITNWSKFVTQGELDAHNQSASSITAGTFAGTVYANRGTSGQEPSYYLVRNSKLASAEENPTNNGEICWQYE